MNAPHLWNIGKECLSDIGETVFVGLFQLQMKFNGAMLTLNIFNTTTFSAYLCVFLLSVLHVYILLYIACLCN
jgi:hypothetical protein